MKTTALVIGAGPYGVGIAQALWERGVDLVVLGRPFELWLEHTLSNMLLRSDHNASEIYSRDGRYSVNRFLARDGRRHHRSERLEVATYRRYLDDVARRLPFGVEQDFVTRLERTNGHFTAALAGGGQVEARSVVVATGIGAHRHLPAELAGLDPQRLIHSWETRRIEALTDQRVLVIGSGQSAAESVEALRARCRVTWALRHPPAFFSEPLRLPTPLFKLLLSASAIYYHLPHAARRVLARAFFQTTVTPLMRPVYDDPAVEKRFADAAELGLRNTPEGIVATNGERYDSVVAATGFRCTLGGLSFLEPSLRAALGPAERAPHLDVDFQSPVPNLFLAGGIAEDTYGPVQRFILGSWRAAQRIGRAIGGRR